MRRSLMAPIALTAAFLCARTVTATPCFDYAGAIQWLGAETSVDGNDVVIDQDLAYIAAGTRGLVILDIADPTNPPVAGEVAFGAGAQEVAISGSYAYVLAPLVLAVVDVAVPQAPSLVTTLSLPASCTAFALDGTHAYATSSSGIYVIDVSVPSAPFIAGQTLWGAVPTRAVAASSHLYFGLTNGLYNLDATDPTNPTLAEWIPGPRLEGAVLDGNTVWMSAIGGALWKIDITVPGSVGIDSVSFWQPLMLDLGKDDEYFVGQTNNSTLQVADDSNPLAPVALPPIPTPARVTAVDVTGSTGIAVTTNEGTHLYSLEPVTRPTALGYVDGGIRGTPGLSDFYAYGFDVEADYAYLGIDVEAYVDTSLVTTRQLMVVDLTDPYAPAVVDSVAGNHYTVRAENGLLFTSDGNLKVYDLATPSSPQFLGSLPGVGTVAIDIHGTEAFVSASTSLSRIDISNPSAPALLFTLPLAASPLEYAYQGNYLYAAAGATGVFVIGLAPHSGTMQLLTTLATTGQAMGAAVIGNTLWVAENDGIGKTRALESFDLTSPQSPVLIHTALIPTNPRGFRVSGTTGYLATDIGLRAVDLTDPALPVFLGAVNAAAAGAGAVAVDVRLTADVAVIFTDIAEVLTAPLQCGAAAVDAPQVAAHTPSAFALRSWPNPARAETVLEFTRPTVGPARIAVYDVAGRVVRELVSGKRFEPGAHRVAWDGLDEAGKPVASGVYFARLETENGAETRRVVRIR